MADSITKLTLEELLLEICENRAEASYSYPSFNIAFIRDEVRITVECNGKLKNFIQFSFLKKISELLQTDNINLEDDMYTLGCSTCDWGSTSEVTIACRDVGIEIVDDPIGVTKSD